MALVVGLNLVGGRKSSSRSVRRSLMSTIPSPPMRQGMEAVVIGQTATGKEHEMSLSEVGRIGRRQKCGYSGKNEKERPRGARR